MCVFIEFITAFRGLIYIEIDFNYSETSCKVFAAHNDASEDPKFLSELGALECGARGRRRSKFQGESHFCYPIYSTGSCTRRLPLVLYTSSGICVI